MLLKISKNNEGVPQFPGVDNGNVAHLVTY
jgi:hypothetical protein